MTSKRYCVQVKERGASVFAGVYWTGRKVVARRYAEAMAQRPNLAEVRVVDELTGHTVDVKGVDK